jgi:hypothetical protein
VEMASEAVIGPIWRSPSRDPTGGSPVLLGTRPGEEPSGDGEERGPSGENDGVLLSY